MSPGEIIEFLVKRQLLDVREIEQLTLRELYVMLDYLTGVRPAEHRPIG